MIDQTTNPRDPVQAAQESFSGKTLTDSQFREAWAISGIIRNEIEKTGSFKDKLTDYAHAFARNEKFEAMRGETIVRDIYQGRFDQTMNQTREALVDREKALAESPDAKARALSFAERVPDLIREGATQPFYKAYDEAAVLLSRDLGITQKGAKDLMKQAYQTAHQRDLYEAGKEVEEAFHKPVREAEVAARKQDKLEKADQTRSQTRSMA